MTQENKNNTFFKVLLSAGLLGFLGGFWSDYYGAEKARELELKKFQYDLLKNTINLKSDEERESQVELLFNTGLLDSTSLNKKLLLDKMRYIRGKQDGKISTSLLNAITIFYKKQGRVPHNTDELLNAFPLKKTFDHLDSQVHYKASASNAFTLILPGADAILYTGDDRRFNFNSLKME